MQKNEKSFHLASKTTIFSCPVNLNLLDTTVWTSYSEYPTLKVSLVFTKNLNDARFFGLYHEQTIYSATFWPSKF